MNDPLHTIIARERAANVWFILFFGFIALSVVVVGSLETVPGAATP